MDFEKRVKDIRDNADKFTKIYKYRYEQKQVNGTDIITIPGISFFGEDYFHYYSERFAKGIEQRTKQISEMNFTKIWSQKVLFMAETISWQRL